MKKLFLLFAVAGMFVACNTKTADNSEQSVDSVATEVVVPEVDTLAVDSAAAVADSLATEVAK